MNPSNNNLSAPKISEKQLRSIKEICRTKRIKVPPILTSFHNDEDRQNQEYKEWQAQQKFEESLKNAEHYRDTRETLKSLENYLKKFMRG